MEGTFELSSGISWIGVGLGALEWVRQIKMPGSRGRNRWAWSFRLREMPMQSCGGMGKP